MGCHGALTEDHTVELGGLLCVLVPFVPLGEVTRLHLCVGSLALAVEWYSATWTGHHLFIHSPVDGCSGC